MRDIKKWIWDFDGTLLDNVEANFRAVNALIQAAGGRSATRADLQECTVGPIMRFYENRGCNLDVVLNQPEIYYDMYECLVGESQLHQHVFEILELLQSRTLRQVVLSNNRQSVVRRHLDRCRVGHFFADILASECVREVITNSLTKRERVLDILKHYQPTDLVLVGDTVEEVEIANEFGIRSIIIASGYQTRHRLEAAKPTMLLNSYLQLLEELL